jgi:hypothetical protein
MSEYGVEFGNEQDIHDDQLFVSRNLSADTSGFSIARFLKATGLIKTDRQATMIMIGMIIICFVTISYVVFGGSLTKDPAEKDRYYIPSNVRAGLPQDIQNRINNASR